MKERDVYEIDFTELLAVCLIKWRRILLFALITAVAMLGFRLLTFEAPPADSLEYRQIERAILNRRLTEEKIEKAKLKFEENQYYTMDPDKIVTMRLSISVELYDQSLITDQIDPTDMILYAYHNMARSELRGDVLVPSLLTKLQMEQLFSCSYDGAKNLLTVTITSDDEELMNSVIAATVEWYEGAKDRVTEQTQDHKLTVLPVSVTVYDRETAEEMVSTLDAEANIRSMEDKILSYNASLDELFKAPENTMVAYTVDEIQEKFEKKVANESSPGIAGALITGFLIGTFAMMIYYCSKELAKGRIHGDSSIEASTGWRRIGRINKPGKIRDGIERWGYRILFHSIDLSEEELLWETRDMAGLLLSDADVMPGAKLALVGDIGEEKLKRLTDCLSPLGYEINASALIKDRVGANKLCRESAAVIFAADADSVCNTELNALGDIMTALDRTPVGYIIV